MHPEDNRRSIWKGSRERLAIRFASQLTSIWWRHLTEHKNRENHKNTLQSCRSKIFVDSIDTGNGLCVGHFLSACNIRCNMVVLGIVLLRTYTFLLVMISQEDTGYWSTKHPDWYRLCKGIDSG
ncbi:hypothetical protein CBL_03125 [Carabus blaptoides fortunei]